MEFEKVFPELCTFGKYQKLIFFFILLPVQLSYFCHIYSHIFLSYQPQYWCRIGDELIRAYNADGSNGSRNNSSGTNTTTVPGNNNNQSSSSSDSKSSSSPNLQSSRQNFEKIFLLNNNNNHGIDNRNLIRLNENFRRYFFIPSIFLVEQLRNNHSNSNLNSKLDLRLLLEQINHSLLNYIDSSSSCHIYNSSSYSSLITFHNEFIGKFLSLLSRSSLQHLQRNRSSNLKPSNLNSSSIVPNRTISDEPIGSKVNENNGDIINHPPIITCNNGWSFSYHQNGDNDNDDNYQQNGNNRIQSKFVEIPETIVTKWNLVCDQEWFQLLALAVFLVGLLFGIPLCHILCFNVGHRKTYFLMLLIQCSSGTGSALVADFKHFCLLRFLLGLSVPTILIVPTDLMVELCGVRIMSRIVFLNELCHLFGAILLTLVAYLIRDYRHLSVAVSAPFIVYIFLWWSFPESANFLLITGKIAQLEKTVLDIAHTNLPYIDYEFDESLKRRIYVELAIYKEFMISSLLNDSFGNRLEQLMNENYVDFNRFDNHNYVTTIDNQYRNYFEEQPTNNNIDGNDITVQQQYPVISTQQVDLHHRCDENDKEFKDNYDEEQFMDDNRPDIDDRDRDEFSDISLPSSIPAPPPPPTATADLIAKLYQHLNGGPEIPLSSTTIVATTTSTTTSSSSTTLMNGKCFSDIPEIWSESESSEQQQQKNDFHSRQNHFKMTNNCRQGSLTTTNSNSSLSSSWSVSNNISSSSTTTTSASTVTGDSAGPDGSRRAGHRLGSNRGQQCHSSLRTILWLPNMRRKLLSLLYLSMTHFSLNVAFNYFVLEFTNLNDYVKPKIPSLSLPSSPSVSFSSRSIPFPSSDETIFHLFGFAIFLNLIATLLGSLLLSKNFGRKFTFFVANILATVFTLITTLLMTTVTTVSNQTGIQILVLELIPVSQLVPFGAHFPLVCYSIAKIFQTTSTLVLVIWLYELLPPIADCSKALHSCFTLANLQLVFIPFLLYISNFLSPDYHRINGTALTRSPETDASSSNHHHSSSHGNFSLESIPHYQSSRINFPVHYLICTAMLSVAGFVCLILPETGSVERLPHSVQEAEMFQQHQYVGQNSQNNGSNCGATSTTTTTTATTSSTTAQTAVSGNGLKWYSLKVLFNFQPPIIHPSGILKKPQQQQQQAWTNNPEESSRGKKSCPNNGSTSRSGLPLVNGKKRKNEIKFAGKVEEEIGPSSGPENRCQDPSTVSKSRSLRFINRFKPHHHRRHHHKPKRKILLPSPTTDIAESQSNDPNNLQNTQQSSHRDSSVWSSIFNDDSSVEHQNMSRPNENVSRIIGSQFGQMSNNNNQCVTVATVAPLVNSDSGQFYYGKFGNQTDHNGQRSLEIQNTDQDIGMSQLFKLYRRHSIHHHLKQKQSSSPSVNGNDNILKNYQRNPNVEYGSTDHFQMKHPRSSSNHDISPSQQQQQQQPKQCQLQSNPPNIHLVLDPSQLMFAQDHLYGSHYHRYHHHNSLPRINNYNNYPMNLFGDPEENRVLDSMMAEVGGKSGPSGSINSGYQQLSSKVRVFDVVDNRINPNLESIRDRQIDTNLYSDNHNCSSDPNLSNDHPVQDLASSSIHDMELIDIGQLSSQAMALEGSTFLQDTIVLDDVL